MLDQLIVDRRDDLIGEATATFSPDRTYRYVLTRVWDRSRPVVIFIMLNPSTADAFAEDNTSTRCVRFARRWMAGGIAVVNLFGLRATDPRALASHPDPVGPDNDAAIAELLAGDLTVATVICAWGANTVVADRDERMVALLSARGARPVCLGLTASGRPRHPLYVRGDAATRPYPPTSER